MNRPVPPGYTLVPETNWWMVSGIVVGLGSVLIGVAFIILGAAAVATGSLSSYYSGFYSLLGCGIALIGLSWTFARMTPRTK